MPKKKEEPLFVEPEFDEMNFIREEKERAKGVVAVFVIGALIGLLSGYLSLIGLWYFSVLIIFIFLLFLKIILNALRIELPKRNSHKFFLVGEFILTWLIFWILFLNPPLHVVSGPQISDLQSQTSTGWANVNEPKLDVYNLPVSDHSVRLYINYKYPITSVSVNEAPAGSPSSTSTVQSNYVGDHVYFNLSKNVGTTYIYKVTAHSEKGTNTYQFTVNFVATSAAISYAASPHILNAGVV